MKKREYTNDDVQNFLEEIGLIWESRQYFNHREGKWIHAKPRIFGNGPVHIMIKNKNNKCQEVIVTITNTEFILSQDGIKADASSEWIEFLNEKKQQTI